MWFLGEASSTSTALVRSVLLPGEFSISSILMVLNRGAVNPSSTPTPGTSTVYPTVVSDGATVFEAESTEGFGLKGLTLRALRFLGSVPCVASGDFLRFIGDLVSAMVVIWRIVGLLKLRKRNDAGYVDGM
jgi:hypothetical protein